MKAMILAAGRGARMRPLTDNMPKPLLPVGGKPLIVWHLEKLAAAGITDIVINTAWLGEKLVAALGEGEAFGVRIQWSHEPAGGLETAGGIMQALPLLGAEPFAVVNGDIWSDLDYRLLTQQQGQMAEQLAHLWLVANPDHHPQGDFCLQGTRVIDKPGFTFAGISVLRPELFAKAKGGFLKLRPFLAAAMAAKQVSGELHLGAWTDVGTVARLQALAAKLTPERKISSNRKA